MNVAGFISGGEGSGGGTPLSSVNQIRADFSKIRGNHTFRTGYDIQWTRFWSLSTGASVAFAPVQTGDPQTPGTGSPLHPSSSGYLTVRPSVLHWPRSITRSPQALSSRISGKPPVA